MTFERNVRLNYFYLLLLLAPVAISGCGGGSDGPERFPLKGSVIFAGQPVQHGQINFVPASKKGNPGPGSLAVIENGTYSTAEEKGILGGSYIIEISGYKPGKDVNPDGELELIRLFPPYSFEADLPSNGGIFDITIPENAASR